MSRLGLVLALGVAACAPSSNSVVCGDGTYCPVGSTCGVFMGKTRCTTPDELVACANKQNGDACTSGTTMGACLDGLCLPTQCGNGIVEPGEVCDDGNLVDGDMCSFGCTSDGSCGNGFLDAMHGEECDDKNGLSHDGCTSGCIKEGVAWSQLETGQPQGLTDMAMTYDAIRNRVYMFGGRSGGISAPDQDRLWELDGDNWQAVDTPVRPPALVAPTFTYDHDAKVSVLFGGTFQNNVDRSTWLWNGSHWAYTNPPSQPRERYYHSAVYDVKNKRVIVFGGFGRNPPSTTDIPLRDTWAWSAGNWTQICDQCAPPARGNAALGYDPVRGVVVLFGGYDASTVASSTPLGDLWELDGSTWTQHTPSGPPPPRKGAIMAYDLVSKSLVLHGGTGGTFGSPVVLDDTYRWNGSTWTHDTSGVKRTGAAFATDPVNARLILYGGLDDLNATSLPPATSKWTFNETNGVGDWNSVGPPNPLGLADFMAAASATYDFTRNQMLLFGLDTNGAFAKTVIVHGTAFQTVNPAFSQPPPRFGARVVTSLANGQTIVYGGFSPSGGVSTALGDMWTWDGTNWNPAPSTGLPPARHSYAMVSSRAGILMFGGCTNPNNCMAETWSWTGSWTKLSPPTSPTVGLARAAMGYDPVSDRVVLFGGVAGNVLPNTWEWDGSTWKKTDPAVSPPPRWGAELVWDAARGKLVLYGGRRGSLDYSTSADAATAFRDAWEYTPQGNNPTGTWTQLDIEAAPPSRLDFAAIPTSAGVQMFGGSGTSGSFGDLHRLRWQGLGADESCGPIDSDGDGAVGCADSDCWASCTPLCPPGTPQSCLTNTPRCGDGTCSVLENHRICPADCGAAPVRCGDFVCDASETCPGECP